MSVSCEVHRSEYGFQGGRPVAEAYCRGLLPNLREKAFRNAPHLGDVDPTPNHNPTLNLKSMASRLAIAARSRLAGVDWEATSGKYGRGGVFATTNHGKFPIPVIKSDLQKAIRDQNVEQASRAAMAMLACAAKSDSTRHSTWLLNRLVIIAAEDLSVNPHAMSAALGLWNVSNLDKDVTLEMICNTLQLFCSGGTGREPSHQRALHRLRPVPSQAPGHWKDAVERIVEGVLIYKNRDAVCNVDLIRDAPQARKLLRLLNEEGMLTYLVKRGQIGHVATNGDTNMLVRALLLRRVAGAPPLRGRLHVPKESTAVPDLSDYSPLPQSIDMHVKGGRTNEQLREFALVGSRTRDCRLPALPHHFLEAYVYCRAKKVSPDEAKVCIHRMFGGLPIAPSLVQYAEELLSGAPAPAPALAPAPAPALAPALALCKSKSKGIKRGSAAMETPNEDRPPKFRRIEHHDPQSGPQSEIVIKEILSCSMGMKGGGKLPSMIAKVQFYGKEMEETVFVKVYKDRSAAQFAMDCFNGHEQAGLPPIGKPEHLKMALIAFPPGSAARLVNTPNPIGGEYQRHRFEKMLKEPVWCVTNGLIPRGCKRLTDESATRVSDRDLGLVFRYRQMVGTSDNCGANIHVDQDGKLYSFDYTRSSKPFVLEGCKFSKKLTERIRMSFTVAS